MTQPTETDVQKPSERIKKRQREIDRYSVDRTHWYVMAILEYLDEQHEARALATERTPERVTLKEAREQALKAGRDAKESLAAERTPEADPIPEGAEELESGGMRALRFKGSSWEVRTGAQGQWDWRDGFAFKLWHDGDGYNVNAEPFPRAFGPWLRSVWASMSDTPQEPDQASARELRKRHGWPEPTPEQQSRNLENNTGLVVEPEKLKPSTDGDALQKPCEECNGTGLNTNLNDDSCGIDCPACDGRATTGDAPAIDIVLEALECLEGDEEWCEESNMYEQTGRGELGTEAIEALKAERARHAEEVERRERLIRSLEETRAKEWSYNAARIAELEDQRKQLLSAGSIHHRKSDKSLTTYANVAVRVEMEALRTEKDQRIAELEANIERSKTVLAEVRASEAKWEDRATKAEAALAEAERWSERDAASNDGLRQDRDDARRERETEKSRADKLAAELERVRGAAKLCLECGETVMGILDRGTRSALAEGELTDALYTLRGTLTQPDQESEA